MEEREKVNLEQGTQKMEDVEAKEEKKMEDMEVKEILKEIVKTLNSGFNSLSQKLDNVSQKLDDGFKSLSQKLDEEKSYLGQIIVGINRIRSEGNEWQLLNLYISKKKLENYRVIHIPEEGADFIVELKNKKNYYIIEVKHVLNKNTLENAIKQLIKRGDEVNCSIPKIGVILARYLGIEDKKMEEIILEKKDEIMKTFQTIEVGYYDFTASKVKEFRDFKIEDLLKKIEEKSKNKK